jgi:xanthine dehydrogenase YagS FAD-binding subunit
MRPFVFVKPKNSSEAASKKNAAAQFIAGGTNLLDLMKKHIAHPDTLVDVSTALPSTIQSNIKGISIGAMARNSTVANHADINSKFPLVAKAILAGASPQIRNMASTGGNLLQRTRCPYFYDITVPCNKRKPGSGCSAMSGQHQRMNAIVGWSENCIAVHPSDFCIALSALDATVVVADKTGKKTAIPFKDFHRLPGTTPDKDNNLPPNAIIHSVDIPNNAFNKHFAYVKLRDRDSYAFALVSAAAALQLNGNKIVKARLASGGVAHKPWRWYAAEQYLKGKEAKASTFSEAANIIVKETKPLTNNGFKASMLRGVIEVALENCLKST